MCCVHVSMCVCLFVCIVTSNNHSFAVAAALSWGVLVYEALYSVNALTGGSLLTTVRCGRARLLLAAMFREARQVRHRT